MTTSLTSKLDSGRMGFAPTQWTVVLAAGRDDPTRAREALARLCEAYWYPLYAYVRRCGHSPEDAQDLVQEFFAQLLAHNWVARADQRKGRFRSFLLMVFNRFLTKEREKARTLKRGGRISLVPLRWDTAETRYAQEPAETQTPDQVFEKHWALALLQNVLKRLRQDYAQDGKGALFEKLEPSLVGARETQPYASLAAELNMSEGSVKVAVCRLRERYRDCLRDEISQTVSSSAEVDIELRHLFRVLARG
ncbi:MAG TPA: sigma-70 family RNA polymerase sigma factor [Candidatus Paceibacterota bacterium]|nr:sigma-70 family RNA polymerase sigma factor [Candidatus Paceibacterota bacterium]